MDHHGVYLYGFVPFGTAIELDGVEGVEGDRPIRTVAFPGSTAVVGEVPLEAFEAAMSTGLDGGPEPAWVIPRALRHEAVLDAVLRRSPVLPARFGTMFSTFEALEALAIAHRSVISGFFETIGDRVEWSLRGYYEPDRAIERLLEVDPELLRRRLALPESPGARYFQEKKLRESARREAGRASSTAAEAVRKVIRSIAGDSLSLPIRGPEGPAREMVLHETFLISIDRATEALALAQSASMVGAGLLTLEPSGPWPPFHFCPDLGGPST